MTNCLRCGQNGYETRDNSGKLCVDCPGNGYLVCKHCGHRLPYCPLPM